MQAVIFAAGSSTRTYPLTVNIPKPLLKIANKTLIEHTLDQLQGVVDDAIVVVGFKKEMMEEHIGPVYKAINVTFVEQKKQEGTGHALKLVEGLVEEHFLVMGGDDLFSRGDIQRCLAHKNCMLLEKRGDARNFGLVEVKGRIVVGIKEKPKEKVAGLISCGLYVLERSVFDLKIKKSKRGEYEITDYLSQLAKKGLLEYELVQDYWLPISYPWDILIANAVMLGKMATPSLKGIIEPNATLKGFVSVGKGTLVKNGAYIEGPVLIGENCVIGPNCYIRGGTTVGNGCKVGNAVELKNSVLMDNVHVGHLSYIGDSVIGKDTNIGAGTITANLRHDDATVKSDVKGALVDSGLRKLGAIIAEGVHTGVHTSLYPGRKIWPGKSTLPAEIVKEDIK